MRESEINNVGGRDDMPNCLLQDAISRAPTWLPLELGGGWVGMKREGDVHPPSRKWKYMEPSSNSVYTQWQQANSVCSVTEQVPTICVSFLNYHLNSNNNNICQILNKQMLSLFPKRLWTRKYETWILTSLPPTE